MMRFAAAARDSRKPIRPPNYPRVNPADTRFTNGHTINRIAELAPWNYVPQPTGHPSALPADLQAAILANIPPRPEGDGGLTLTVIPATVAWVSAILPWALQVRA